MIPADSFCFFFLEIGFPLLTKVEAAGQHYQVFASRKQSQRTYSEQERHDEANAQKDDEEGELSADEEEPAYLVNLLPKEWKVKILG